MYKGRKIAVVVPAFNEEVKIARVVERTDHDLVDAFYVVDDGSTDGTADAARRKGAEVLSTPRRGGVGAALRLGIEHARNEGFDLCVIMAGNNKDDPSEISRLIDPICDDDADLVVGSRHMVGGRYGGDMPLYRRFATRVHPWLMSVGTRRRLTESTNGFRAFRLTLLDDQRINLKQRWLDAYGLEVYLLWKVLKLGYRHAEVPCTKIYPPKAVGYTKMKPITGWWSMLRPILLLGLGLRQ